MAFVSFKIGIGIELNHELVRAFNTKFPDIDYQVGSIENFPYPDTTFDSVLSFGVLEHLIHGSEKALAEMLRIL